MQDLEQKKGKITELEETLEIVKEELEDTKMNKPAYKEQKEELQVRLNGMQNEFGFDNSKHQISSKCLHKFPNVCLEMF